MVNGRESTLVGFSVFSSFSTQESVRQQVTRAICTPLAKWATNREGPWHNTPVNSAHGAFRGNFAALRVGVLMSHRAKRVLIHFDDDDQIERWV